MSESYKEEWLAGPQSTQFYTRTYTPPSSTPTKAAIVFIHGFAEHVGRYNHFHPLLAQRGIGVFAFDQRGFGLTAQDTSGKKSPSSSWAKTCWAHQMEDINWAVSHAKSVFPGTPLFLMGHSMGGAETLGFCAEGTYKDSLALLKGAISTSPFLAQAKPAPAIVKWIGAKASLLMPNFLIPTDLNADELSHDDAFNSAYVKDPLIKATGSLRGLSDMMKKGEELSTRLHQKWPKDLPVLIVHGTEDKVACHQTVSRFHEALSATKKKLHLFQGGFHELQNEPDGVKEQLLEMVVEFIEESLGGNTKATSEAAPLATPKANL